MFTYDNAGNQTRRPTRAATRSTPATTRWAARSSAGRARRPARCWPRGSTTPRPAARASRTGRPPTPRPATGSAEALGYDTKGRATGSRLTVPAGIPGLSGRYTVTQTYDRADRVRTVTYPAIGGLPAETVTTDYNTLGLPTRLAGIDEYVWDVVYDDRGRRTSAGLGPRPGGTTWMGRTWTYDVDQRINAAETFVAGAGVVSRHDLAFDLAGNLTEKLTRQGGLSWRECFGYDPRSRLRRRTPSPPRRRAPPARRAPATGRTPTRTPTAPDGKLTARTENGVPTAYTYPAAGAARPHAPTRVGADTYTWDASGNLTARTVGGRSETFTWDVAGPAGLGRRTDRHHLVRVRPVRPAAAAPDAGRPGDAVRRRPRGHRQRRRLHRVGRATVHIRRSTDRDPQPGRRGVPGLRRGRLGRGRRARRRDGHVGQPRLQAVRPGAGRRPATPPPTAASSARSRTPRRAVLPQRPLLRRRRGRVHLHRPGLRPVEAEDPQPVQPTRSNNPTTYSRSRRRVLDVHVRPGAGERRPDATRTAS